MLGNRRDVLTQLVNVQTLELRESLGIPSQSNYGPNYGLNRLNLGRKSDNKSVISNSSGESWATFASKNSEMKNKSVYKLPNKVPKLKL